MEHYEYVPNKHFMAWHEIEFFHVLQRLLGTDYYIFPQIHIGTLLRPRLPWKTYNFQDRWMAAFTFADKFSVDYVICNHERIEPILAIELDGSSHEIPKRQRRDRIINDMFAEANMPLLRINNDEAQDVQGVLQKLAPYLQNI